MKHIKISSSVGSLATLSKWTNKKLPALSPLPTVKNLLFRVLKHPKIDHSRGITNSKVESSKLLVSRTFQIQYVPCGDPSRSFRGTNPLTAARSGHQSSSPSPRVSLEHVFAPPKKPGTTCFMRTGEITILVFESLPVFKKVVSKNPCFIAQVW